MISVYGSGEANRLAGGISEALITTEVGLFVAIPALIWHALLSRRLRKIVGNLELAMLSFINALTLRKIV
jgi:biopolymer transport protein ExbB